MKKNNILLFTIVISSLCFVLTASAQMACPTLSANNPVLPCGTTCATITATPSVDLAATTSYSVTSVSYSPMPFTGTIPTYSGVAWSASTDDDFGDLIPLPFNFCFFGNSYNAIVIGTNGNISFNTTGASSLVNSADPWSISGPLPGSNCTATENCIMGVWNDTYVGGGPITYASYGVAPCRTFVISWDSVDLFLPGTYCDGNLTKSQIVLYETFNTIDIYIGRRAPCIDWNDGLAVCGIENASGSTFYCPPGENGTTFTATNEGWRFTPTGATSGWHYTWAGSGITAADTTASIVVCPSGSGVYTVTATSASCSGVTISTTSTLSYTGSAGPISGTATVCVGDTAMLSDITGGGVWSSSNPSVAMINSAGIVMGLSAGTATITYTDSSCSATMTFTVNPIPPAPIVNHDTYCQFGTAVPVSATGSGLLWYGPGVTTAMTVAPTPSTSLAGTVTYFVTQTVAGCVSDSATDIVTIIPKPAPPVTKDTSYCQYSKDAVSLDNQVTHSAGATLNWYSNTGAPLSGAPLPSTAASDYPVGTTWYVSQTVNGCESDRAPVKVTILPTPVFTLTYQNWVCDGDSVSINYAVSPGSSLVGQNYSWIIPANATLANGTTVGGSSITLKFDTVLLVNTGYLTISNLGGVCSTTDTFNIKVVALPFATTYCKPDVCKGDTTFLSLISRSADASNFSWYVDGNDLLTSPAVNIVTADASTGGPYLISWNDTGVNVIEIICSTVEGCISKPFLDTVNVHQIPDANFDVLPINNGSLCIDDSMLFKAHLQNDGYAYVWEPVHFFNNNNKPVIYGTVDETKSLVTLTVTDPFGCKSSVTNEIDPDNCCIVSFPSAFTPNGDGKNDFFRPIYAGFHRFHDFRIVNRWGQTIFESANSNPEWDGNLNGTPQDMGVYFYYLKYDCGGKTLEQKGDCTLIR